MVSCPFAALTAANGWGNFFAPERIQPLTFYHNCLVRATFGR